MPATGAPSRSLATSPSFWIAALSVALHAAVIGRYGIFRDELYYIACGRHLAWGYVDHPPGVALFARLAETLFGTSPQGLRILPILAGALVVFLAGRLARELGGGRFAEALASLAVLVAPVLLYVFHYLSMNVLDALFWTLALLLLLKILNGGDPRLWLAFGLVTGLGLENKLSVLFLGAGVVVGLLLTPERRLFASRWPWLGGALALALLAPHIAWQIANGWPTREFVANATAHKNIHYSPLAFLGEQIKQMHPMTLPLWLGGLAWFAFSKEGRRYRALAIAYVAIFALLVAQGGKPYYLAPIYPLLFAAGARAFEGLLAARNLSWPKPAALALLAAGGAATAPLTLPLLPIETFIRYEAALGLHGSSGERHAMGRLPQHYADMFGWEDLTATVAHVWRTIPEAERPRCAIFGQDYGQAGAIDVLGDRYGLPDALSGHNSYFLWGPRGYDGRC
ncbi:MAG TPA: glycosyltransferase family 39 protein, partial [Thermoanaerobaculia bacterium]|nr:glycosyltransferase family 39 protein [Thermoanaerobaculia bacterium]